MYKLKKSNLLHKNKSFQKVYRVGKSYANRMLVVYMMPNHTGVRHVGFAAGKRLGSAVARNRVKRLLRETYRLNQSSLKTGVDLIFVGRQSMVGVKYTAVEKAFFDLCAKAKILAK